MPPRETCPVTFFDAFVVKNRLARVQGEVSGRGVPSALLVAMGQTLLRSFLKQGLSPATALPPERLRAISFGAG